MRPAALLLVLALTGCATIFTGSKQTIHIETQPPRAIVVVVGTPAASLILALKKSSDLSQRVVSMLSPFLSEAASARLRELELDELVTRLVAWLKLDMVPPELVGEVRSKVPAMVADGLLSLLSIEDVGVSPMKVKLRKGRKYAVLTWQEGHHARVAGIDMHFNWVSLLNVFTAFLGFIVDVPTGAWFNLGPDHLILTL